MSQQIEVRANGRAYPVMVCDQCGKRILEATDGNTLWRESLSRPQEERFIPIYHIHRYCTWEFMHVRFPRPVGSDWSWKSHNLEHDLFMLLLNVKYRPEEAECRAQRMAMYD